MSHWTTMMDFIFGESCNNGTRRHCYHGLEETSPRTGCNVAGATETEYYWLCCRCGFKKYRE